MGGMTTGRRQAAHLALTLAACAIWRLPALWEPPWINDEGTYATVGHLLRGGALLYRDIWENKPPGVYLLYAAADALGGPAGLLPLVRLAASLAALSLGLLAYLFVRRGLRGGHGRALVAAFVASMIVDTPLVEGTTANAEIFMAPLILAAVALAWPTPPPSTPGPPVAPPATHAALAGALLGLAMLFKAVALADALAIMGILAIAREPSSRGAAPATRSQQRALLPLLALLLGLAVPLAATAIYFAAQGPTTLQAAAFAMLGYNLLYVGAPTTGAAALVLFTVRLGAGAAVIYLFVLYARAARPRAPGHRPRVSSWLPTARRSPPGVAALPSWPTAALSLWTACALLGAISGARPHAHYLLQLAAPLACLLAVLLPLHLTRGVDRRPARTVGLAALVITAALIAGSAVVAHQGPAAVARAHTLAAYYAGAWWLASGRQSAGQFAADLDPRVSRTIALASRLRALPLIGCPRALLVWGNAPWVYYLSGLSPATPYTSADYRPAIPGATAALIAATRHTRAGALVILDPTARRAVLTIAHTAGYQAVTTVADALLLRSPHCRP